MGCILDTDSKILGIEERRESFIILDLERIYPKEQGNDTDKIKSNHIFAYADGEIEVSKEFLIQLIEFFECEENRKRLK